VAKNLSFLLDSVLMQKVFQISLKWFKIFQAFLGSSVHTGSPSLIQCYPFIHIWASPKPAMLFFMLFRNGPGVIAKD